MLIKSPYRLDNLKFTAAVTGKDASRVVFQLGTSGVYAVVKTFKSAPLTTVKFWNLEHSSLDKTMSYWSTKTPFTPDVRMLTFCRAQVVDVMTNLADVLWSSL